MSASLRIALTGAALTLLAFASASAQVPISPSPSALPRGANACAVHAPEAARRSELPVDVILRVMRAESRGRPRAISHKGAMGCMQIMPPTWSYLTRRYGLGSDPWNPRMNMIGGALYLAEMVRQFGYPGAYAAYNAGPGRYQRHVRNGVPLPAETIAYTAQITGRAQGVYRVQEAGAAPLAPRWQDAALFVPPAAPQPAAPRTGVREVEGDDVGPRAVSPHALFPLLHPAAMTTGTGKAAPDGE